MLKRNGYNHLHIGYVVLHRDSTWINLCSTSKDLFFRYGHDQCNTQLNKLNPSLQIFASKSSRGIPLMEIVILTSNLKILQRRIRKRLRILKTHRSILNREITNKFLIKYN